MQTTVISTLESNDFLRLKKAHLHLTRCTRTVCEQRDTIKSAQRSEFQVTFHVHLVESIHPFSTLLVWHPAPLLSLLALGASLLVSLPFK